MAVNGCDYSIFTSHNFVSRKEDWFSNGSVALSLLKDKHVAPAPGWSGSVGTLPNLTDPFPMLFPYF